MTHTFTFIIIAFIRVITKGCAGRWEKAIISFSTEEQLTHGRSGNSEAGWASVPSPDWGGGKGHPNADGPSAPSFVLYIHLTGVADTCPWFC